MKILLVLAVLVFAGSTGWNVLTRVSTQKNTVTSIDQVIKVLETECFEEEDFKEQYKVRGEDVEVLAETVKLIIRKAEPVTVDLELRSALRDSLPKLQVIIDTITILPLPDCEARADRLRANLPEG